MPKISKHGGPSDAGGMTDFDPVPIQREEIQGNGGATSAGMNSTPSSESGQTSSGSEKASRQSPAPTTENRSSQPEKDDSSAHSTAGNIQETKPQPSAKKAGKAGSKSAHTRAADDSDDDDW
jgi:hypothetical protein